jgi:hypothetical protein
VYNCGIIKTSTCFGFGEMSNPVAGKILDGITFQHILVHLRLGK